MSQNLTNSTDLFAFKINYNDPDVNFVGDALFNGNISQTYWKSNTDNIIKNYGYDYDELNRLKDAKFYSGSHVSYTDRYNENLTYDKNGNITNLSRRGSHNAFNQVIDQLIYSYDGNQLKNVAEDPMGNASAGFIDGHVGTLANPDYTYDTFGNMITDQNKKISNIRYNHLNLPTEIVFNNNHQTKINYTYNAAGVKVQKVANLDLNDQGQQKNSTTLYLVGYQYNNNVLQFFPHAQGYVRHNVNPNKYEPEYDYVYQYKDHLGNIRINYTFDIEASSLKILEENHYYPFGLKHTDAQVKKDIVFEKKEEEGEEDQWEKKISTQPKISKNEMVENSRYQYKYNGKEWQDELGLNVTAMDFRQYDSAIGRFYGIDALAEYSFDKTPYRFGFNNPNIWSDPTGLFETEEDAKKHIDKYGLSKAKISYNDSRGVYEIENNGFNFWQQGNDMGMAYTDSEGSPTLRIIKGGASKDLSSEKFNATKSQSNFFPVDFNSSSYLNVNAAKFGSNRDNGKRKHAGIDIYAPVGTNVKSISDGVVIRDPYHFYRGSYALEIDHGTYTIRYTEINPLNLKMGDSVKAGQDIGTIMKMKGINNTMLHLEKYSNTKKGSLTDRNNPPYQRRGDLVNPTNFIDSLRVNQF